MLTDAGALALSLFVAWFSRQPVTAEKTYGYLRWEILAALINGATLLLISVWIVIEAIGRLHAPEEVGGTLMLTVAVVGLLVNALCAWMLARANRASLNVEGAYQHILTDLYGFLGTVAAGVVILTTGYVRADSIASLVVVALMLRAAWGLLRDSGRILLQAAPEHVDLEQVRAHLLEVEHVRDVHDLHVWTITSGLHAMSAHIVVRQTDVVVRDQLINQIKRVLAERYNISHTTLQIESESYEHECHVC